MSGSLWNKNSWHWEERNHTQQATAMLVDSLSSLPLPEQYKIGNFVFKGYANSSIRKGKLIVAFEFTASAEVTGLNERIGNLSIDEFSQDELSPRVTVPGQISDHKKLLTDEIHRRITNFASKFRASLEDETAKAADQARREEELQKAQEAEKAKGEEKRKLLEETKMREQISAPSVRKAEEVKASVWNANAYHWETKNAWNFVKEFLHGKFQDKLGLTIDKISGEAEVSVRKGKKIVVFDLKLESEIFSISDLTQDDIDGDFRVVWKSEEKKIPKDKFSEIFQEMAEQMKNL